MESDTASVMRRTPDFAPSIRPWLSAPQSAPLSAQSSAVEERSSTKPLNSTSGGVAAASGPGEPNEYGFGVLIVGVIGAAVGALTGYLIGSRKHRVLIYATR